MVEEDGISGARTRYTFSLRGLLILTAAVALLVGAAMILHNLWQQREIVIATQPHFPVSEFDAHLKTLAATYPSIRNVTTDHPTNTLLIVCQYGDSSAVRQAVSPYLANPQILRTAEMLDLPLPEVLAMSQGDFETLGGTGEEEASRLNE